MGYARVHSGDPAAPRVFLAADPDAARLVASSIVRDAGAAEIILPIHPRSRSGGAFEGIATQRWEAAMAIPLGQSSLDRYFSLVGSGERPVGRVTWPVTFDL